jgi:hypothetical protein
MKSTNLVPLADQVAVTVEKEGQKGKRLRRVHQHKKYLTSQRKKDLIQGLLNRLFNKVFKQLL